MFAHSSALKLAAVLTLHFGLLFTASAQDFCLESFTDFQAHFHSSFGGDSHIDEYGNISIDGQTGGRGGWPEFRITDVEIRIEHLPEGSAIGGAVVPHRLATLHYTCRNGPCIQRKVFTDPIDSAYTILNLEQAERCLELFTYLQGRTEFW